MQIPLRFICTGYLRRSLEKIMVTIRQIQPSEWGVGRTVRLAALTDSPGAFSETYDEAAAMPDKFWQGRAERGAKGETSVSVIAYAEDKPIGMAVGIADQTDRNTGYLAAMWVAPAHRGSGVADALVDSVAAWATSSGIATLFAGVLGGNCRAAAFYRKAGFSETTGFVPEHPTTDGAEVVFNKTLKRQANHALEGRP